MPTTTDYTGNSASVQNPSPAPGVGVDPILRLPTDAAAWTVANFYQAFKVLADFISFLRKIFAGVLSAKSLAVDGVGGAAAAPPAGAVQVSASAAGTALPTPAFSKATTYKESSALMEANFHLDGSSVISWVWGFNVSSVLKNSTGTYFITCVTDPAATTSTVPIASCSNAGVGVAPFMTTNGGHVVIGFQFYDTSTKAAIDPTNCNLYIRAAGA